MGDRTGAEKGLFSEQHVVEWYRVQKIAHATRTRTHQPANTRRTRLSVEQRVCAAHVRERLRAVINKRLTVVVGAGEQDQVPSNLVHLNRPRGQNWDLDITIERIGRMSP